MKVAFESRLSDNPAMQTVRLYSTLGVTLLLLTNLLGCGSRTSLLPAPEPPADSDASVTPNLDANIISPPSVGCDACPSEDLTWSWDGGFVAGTERMGLIPCPSFERVRQSVSAEGPNAICEAELSCTSNTPDEVSAESLGRLLSNRELRLAFSEGDSTLYGLDSRVVDGPLLSVTLGGQNLLIGDECPPASDCRPIPETLLELRELLIALDQQMRRVERCLETDD